MVGFMKKPLGFAGGGIGSLGFASGIGAAIGGAAKQENLNIEAQAAQDRQQDIIDQSWAAKTDQAAKDYKSQQGLYNSIYAITGDAKQAETAMSMLPKNPKSTDIQAAISMVKSNVPTDSNYQPQLMQQRFQDLQRQYNNLPYKYQRQLGDINNLNPNQGQGQQTPFNPQPQQTPSGATQGQLPPAQPQGVQAAGTATDNLSTPLGVTNSPGVQGNGQPITPQQYGRPYIAPNTSKPMTPYEQQRIQNENTRTDIEQKKFDFQKQTKPASFDEQKGIEVVEDDIKHYLHDPKTGLQAQHADLQKLGGQQLDVNNMMDMLNAGFQASAPQDVFDNLNRFTTSILGLDLNSLGISNKVNDTNYMKKVIAQGIINRLSQLHFGRITNAEMGMVEKGFASPTNDPDTNIKIAMTLRNSIEWAIKEHTAQYNAVYGNGPLPLSVASQVKLIDKARNAGSQVYQEYLKQSAPWTQYDPRQAKTPVSQEKMYNSLPMDSWVENMSNHHMYYKSSRDGMLHQAGTDING